MRYAARALLILSTALLMVSVAPVPAAADDRPTSGDMSLFSGRTLGNGESALAAGLGWPGIWAEVMFAPSSTFNMGFKGSVLYGSPVMGLAAGGVGGSLSVPMRLWLFGKGTLDIAAFVEPMGFAGEGTLAGETAAFSDNFAWGVMTTLGALAGAHVTDSVTITFGLGGDVALVSVTGGGHTSLVGTGIAFLGVEALMSRDTMLFAELRGGLGFKPELLFEGSEVVRASLGLAYQL